MDEQSSDIHVQNLSLSFPIFHGGSRSLKKMLVKRSKNLLSSSRFTERKTGGEIKLSAGESGVIEIQALHNISFHVQTGERVGLIGHNGAGKSTLLRVLAGIYMPDSPEVNILGKVTSLLDINAGMNDILTGRENIALAGLQKGLNMRQINQLEKDVEEFAQLEAFLDLPMRLYSTGMRIRLGFGLATAITPKILLMDEWFMAGDAHFQKRAEHRLLSVIDQTDILVITSHDLNILEKWCTRLLWMEEGHIRQDGPAKEVVAAYRASVT